MERKEAEAQFHDKLRSDDVEDYYLANLKYYSIEKSDTEFRDQFVKDHCGGKRVLDYCCGDGSYSVRLARFGAAEVVGIDISPVSIDRARQLAEKAGLSNVQFEVMDAEATTFEDNSFDLITIYGALHHLDLDAAYHELARIVRPSGLIVATEALRHNPMLHLYRKLTPHLRTTWEVDHILGRPEIFCARKYFEDVRVLRFFHFCTLLAVPLRNTPLFEPVRRTLSALDWLLLRIPGLKWMAWIGILTFANPRAETKRGSATGFHWPCQATTDR